jgi:hypothetical protein
MKLFAYRVFRFFLPFFLLFLAEEIYVRDQPSIFAEKKEQFIAQKDSIEILILGNSHSMDAFNPNFFSLYAYNLAFASQSLYFDRRITEKYLADLPRLKYVIITLDYANLYRRHEEKRDFFYSYVYDINYEDRKFYKEYLLQSLFVYTQKEIFSVISFNGLIPSKIPVKKGWFGNSLIDVEAVTSKVISKEQADVYNLRVRTDEEGDAILEDLDSFILNLKSKKIVPILVTTPYYSVFRSFLSKDVVEDMRIKTNYLSEKHGIRYYDFEQDDRFLATDYHNCDHLNGSGAKKLTLRLDSIIRQIEQEKK